MLAPGIVQPIDRFAEARYRCASGCRLRRRRIPIAENDSLLAIVVTVADRNKQKYAGITVGQHSGGDDLSSVVNEVSRLQCHPRTIGDKRVQI